MRRHSRPLVAVLLAAAVGLVAAGCGSDDPGTATGSAQPAAADRDKAVKFAACMRENGVDDFPDPDPDADNDFDYGITVSDTVWGRAIEACRELQPPGTFSAERDAGQQAAALEFAECVREHGVTDFPDPVDGEPLVDTNRIPSSNREGGMAVLNAAMKACGDAANRAIGDRP